MTTRKYAIPDKVANIVLKYGPNISKGIQQMEKLLNDSKQSQLTVKS